MVNYKHARKEPGDEFLWPRPSFLGFLGGTRTPRLRDTRNGLGAEHCLSLRTAQRRSLNAGKQSFSVKYISDLYSKNVHHANEPSSCGDGSYGEIRRSCLCLAPLIHLLRGPRARVVRPWVYGRRQVKTSARGIDGEKAVSREEI